MQNYILHNKKQTNIKATQTTKDDNEKRFTPDISS